MNPYLVLVVVFIAGTACLDVLMEWLNLSRISPALPAEFAGVYDPERYRTAQQYLRVRTRFGIGVRLLTSFLLLGFILIGGFEWVDEAARSLDLGSLPTGLVFIGLLAFGSSLLRIPISAWSTFVIEERFGFNRTRPGTFVLDLVKGWVLSLVLGGPLLAAILWVFARYPGWAWLMGWLLVTLVSLVMMLLSPVLILPIFYKFEPLADGELRAAIEAYAGEQRFQMKGVFGMDGSRRSSKTNAFFTGVGRFRRIVLLDTLIAKHPVEELVAVVAHEMGHYKKGHILFGWLEAFLSSGVMFFLLSLFMQNESLFQAFGMRHLSIYASLVFFGFLYTPIQELLSIAGNALSRWQERAADAFAVRTTGRPEALVEGLKRLTVENLGNLTPHPWYVALYWSHPPILERIHRIRAVSSKG